MNSLSNMIPSSKAFSCIIDGLSAISLNTDARQKVVTLLPTFFEFFSQVKFLKPLSASIAGIGTRFEELLRHQTSLLESIVDSMLQMIQSVCEKITQPEVTDEQAEIFVSNVTTVTNK